ncbi:MAG: glyceraldehyde-3-phosphate dehydrogenase (NAD(P)) [Bradymonadia bacterium]|jgi:glyceraldehyde-3-phosphate dehydrogenase (NAD(P))
MNVAIVGLGTVGETLVSLLLEFQELLPADEIFVIRRAVPAWDKPRVRRLEAAGATIVTRAPADGYPSPEDVQERIEFVFDCGPNGHALASQDEYDSWSSLRGAVAQGSETGFGPPFMTGVGHTQVAGAARVQVVSCNTHGLSAILQALSGPRLENVEEADFVIVRRSEDLGKSERLVAANVVARHRDAIRGTHHAHDVARLFREIDVEPLITSSDITTPSQLLHAVRFRVTTKVALDAAEAFAARPWIATTGRFDSDAIFERGRRAGFVGRVWAHAVVVSNNLMQHGRTITGWAFVPQECNSIPSTVHAWLLQCEVADSDRLMEELQHRLAVSEI